MAEAAAAQDAPGKIIAFPEQAVESVPAFGSAAWYTQFRAEFVRLKGMSVYERMAEKDARRSKPVVPTVDGVPVWAHAAYRPKWYDAEGRVRRGRSALRETASTGEFDKHRMFGTEIGTLRVVERQADVWVESKGRAVLTEREYEALMHEREYLLSFQNHADRRGRTVAQRFAQTHQRWIASLGAKVILDPLHAVDYVAYRMNMSKQLARLLLENAGRVAELRALMGCDDLFVCERAAQESADVALAA